MTQWRLYIFLNNEGFHGRKRIVFSVIFKCRSLFIASYRSTTQLTTRDLLLQQNQTEHTGSRLVPSLTVTFSNYDTCWVLSTCTTLHCFLSSCAVFALLLKEYLWPWLQAAGMAAESEAESEVPAAGVKSRTHEPRCSFTLQQSAVLCSTKQTHSCFWCY